jgi:hypothetical protein
MVLFNQTNRQAMVRQSSANHQPIVGQSSANRRAGNPPENWNEYISGIDSHQSGGLTGPTIPQMNSSTEDV